MKYKEIFKLKKMLEDARIPFDWIEGWGYTHEQIVKLMDIAPDLIERYQIIYPNNENRKISVIESFGTYGAEQDRLEIMGGFTPWERFSAGYGEETNPCMGYLTAHNVFKRIKKDWEENKNERRRN